MPKLNTNIKLEKTYFSALHGRQTLELFQELSWHYVSLIECTNWGIHQGKAAGLQKKLQN